MIDSRNWKVSGCSIQKINLFELALNDTRFRIIENTLHGADDTNISIVYRKYAIRYLGLYVAVLSITWYIQSNELSVGVSSAFPAILESTHQKLIGILNALKFTSLDN